MHSPSRAGIDHEVDAALLALEVELAGLVEDGGHDREDAPIGGGLGHRFAPRAAQPSPIAFRGGSSSLMPLIMVRGTAGWEGFSSSPCRVTSIRASG